MNITDAAVQAAATLSTRYLPDRFLPDKAIDLLDEAGSRVRLRGSYAPQNVRDAMSALERVRKEKDEAIAAQQYEMAAELRDQELGLTQNLNDLEKEWKSDRSKEPGQVTEEDIAEVVSMWTGIPVTAAGQGGDGAAAAYGVGAAQAHHRAG